MLSLDSELGRALITDCTRFYEGLLSEAAVRKKYRFDDGMWERLGADEALVEAIEAEKIRRMRSGDTAREKAQKHYVRAPDVMATILDDAGASPRHRIESARELRAIAAVGPDAAPADRDRFIITINLGDKQETYNKSIAITPFDSDLGDTAAPREVVAANAVRKSKESGGGGEHL